MWEKIKKNINFWKDAVDAVKVFFSFFNFKKGNLLTKLVVFVIASVATGYLSVFGEMLNPLSKDSINSGDIYISRNIQAQTYVEKQFVQYSGRVEGVSIEKGCGSDFSGNINDDWEVNGLIKRNIFFDQGFSFEPTAAYPKGALLVYKRYFSNKFGVNIRFKRLSDTATNFVAQIDSRYRVIVGDGDNKSLIVQVKNGASDWIDAKTDSNLKKIILTNEMAKDKDVELTIKQEIVNSYVRVLVSLKYYSDNSLLPQLPEQSFTYNFDASVIGEEKIPVAIGILEDKNVVLSFESFQCYEAPF